jgi:hypothetical protein
MKRIGYRQDGQDLQEVQEPILSTNRHFGQDDKIGRMSIDPVHPVILSKVSATTKPGEP